MSGRLINTSRIDDNRAVAPVIGVVILFGFLILALSLYQVEIVPQQNAETGFKHTNTDTNTRWQRKRSASARRCTSGFALGSATTRASPTSSIG
ncbi:hypothetical protein EXE50_12435 [Halorubrum sp. ARQ200]|nr:hypothetical protein EXE50_12435 [Halorubrum sp. ARQ200]